MIACPRCGKFYSRMGIGTHIWRTHTRIGKKHKPTPIGTKPWNTGLTKEEHPAIGVYSKKVGKSLAGRKKQSTKTSTRKKISKSMKKAHSEGRAWNIGYNRHRGKQSYAEEFFEKAINREFLDKNYVCELQFFRYRFDFAWPDKMKVIEIDGKQHYRNKAIAAKDKVRDKLSKEHGWDVLRIKFSQMHKNPQKYITIAKAFIDG